VGASGLGGGARAGGEVAAGVVVSSGAGTIAVRVDTRVKSVAYTRVVRAVDALSGAGGVGAEASSACAAETMGASGVASTGDAMSTGGVAEARGAVAGGRRVSDGVGTITVRVDTGVKGVGNAGAVGAMGTLGGVVASTEARGCGAVAGGSGVSDGVGTIAVRINTGVHSVGYTRAVWAVSALGGARASKTGAAELAVASGAVRSASGTESRGASGVGVGVAGGAGTVPVRVDTWVESVGYAGVVRSMCALSGAGGVSASGAYTVGTELVVTGSAAYVVRAITVRVDAGIGGVGNTGVVWAGGTLGLAMAVRVDGVLDLVDDARHIG